MANSSYSFKEIRFIIKDGGTDVYVLLQAEGDSPIGVQGWHFKGFSPDMNILDLVMRHVPNAIDWPLKAPP